jgi:competence ComEA-like helix-hairpin-helix protein
MTEQNENVEPPLATSRVQITLLVIVACLFVVSIVSGRANQAPPSLEGSSEPFFQVDLNTAPPRELSLLPQVGPVLAERIAQNRNDEGPFTSIDGLSRVHGIGPKTLKQIRQYCIILPSESSDHRMVHRGSPSSKSGTFDAHAR